MEPTVVSAADPVSGLHFRLFLCNQQVPFASSAWKGQTPGRSRVETLLMLDLLMLLNVAHGEGCYDC